ncbi:polyhydroxyalkanoate depolymerase, partial [Candidatus Poribacteria bacterium]|nr:polyhydroxyalkanoate depolymerase [Candidatus Poribacteria bacterium]
MDSDVGQSWIGPPTTIGMKIVTQDFESSLFPDAFYFVGNISPNRCLLQTVIGTKLMVDRAISFGAELVIIDTTGLVDGSIGRALKTGKIELVRPDHIVCFQRGNELETLIKSFETISHYHIYRLNPSKEVTKKSQEWRKEYRQKQFEQYFSDFIIQDFSFTQ